MIVLVIIAVISVFAYALLLNTYTGLWSAIDTRIHTTGLDVTVVVAFRNEENNLPSLLESLQQQNYPEDKVTVLFMDDHSSDKGAQIIKNFQLKFEHKVIPLQNGHGKKAAVRLAWQYAENEIVIHTDADCWMGPEWLKTVSGAFGDASCDMVSSPVNYEAKSSFFSRLVALDFASLVTIGASHIQWNHPMICNGANLAYRKSWVSKLNLEEQEASGEDVFIMKSINMQGGGIVFLRKSSAMVTTKGPESFKAFINQRIRWASKNTGYAGKTNNTVLVFSWLFNVLMIGVFLVGTKLTTSLFLFMLVVKLYAESRFYSRIAGFFGLKQVYNTLFLGQAFHIIYMAVLPLASKIWKYDWKDRKW